MSARQKTSARPNPAAAKKKSTTPKRAAKIVARAAARPAAKSTMSKSATVDSYIAGFSPEIQSRLRQMQATIARLAPEATETIGYGIPTFKLEGNLVHYAGYANHVGFYPGGVGIAAFQNELAGYKSSKGSVQFPHDRPLPLALVKKIVKFRVAQNKAKAAERARPGRK